MTKEQFLTTPYSNEDQFTAATHRYINANYPELRHFYFHVPNESATSDAMRLKLAAMGVLPAVPDFVFIKPKLAFLELKMPNGTLSPKQKALHKLWLENGFFVYTAYSPLEVINFLLTLAP